MVDIEKTKKIVAKEETNLLTARIPVKYLEALKKDNVEKTSFVLQAFKETYPNL